MNSSDFTKNTIEAAVRLGLLLMLATWCFNIVTPFIVPVMWGVIMLKHQVASNNNKPSLTAASIVFFVKSELFIVILDFYY